jgi:predicted CXXCH cytochrome family protein
MIKKLPKHIARLLFLLSFFLILALVAKSFLTDPSFYKYGHYRADAIPELAAGEPVYKGSAFCLGCHEQRAADWQIGTHAVVQCEVCHGPYRGCPENGKAMLPADTIRLCSTCHEAMPSRPARQPQIVLAEHPFPDVEKPQCKTCHNPHSPTVEELLEEASVAVAGTEAIVAPPAAAAKCLKCHGKQGQGRRNNPPLAGLNSAAFIEMMNQFKSGATDSKTMARYAKSLSDEEIAELARHYEGLPVTTPEPPHE